MKIAYCFHGNVAGLTEKACKKTAGGDKVLDLSAQSLFDNISDNMDFFIHSWNPEYEDIFKKYYSPKTIECESQKSFVVPDHLKRADQLRVQAHYSRWYSFSQVISSLNKYCDTTGTFYDLVAVARHDLYWKSKFSFQNINPEDINFDQCYANGGPFSTTKHVGDRLICSSKNNINKLADLYNMLGEYTKPGNCPQYGFISSHFCIPWHLEQKNLKSKIKFPYVYWTHGLHNIEKSSFMLVRDYYKLNNE